MAKRTQSHAEFEGERFRQRVDDALETVKKMLDETKIPTYAADVDHEYDDKFGLAEFLTNTSLAATVNALERIGLDGNKLSRLMELSDKGKRSVTLRLAVGETCEFVKEETVEVVGPHTYEHTTEPIETKLDDEHDGTAPAKETKKSVSVRGKVITKVLKKVVEYHWKFSVKYSLYAFVGSDPDDVTSRVPLQDRSSSRGIVTIGNKVYPRHGRVTREPVDASITWLLKNLSSDGDSECKQLICSFSVDRTVNTCRTPRRNDDIESAITFFHDFGMWCNRIKTYFVGDLAEDMARYDNVGPSAKKPKASSDLSSINTNGIFVPVLPLFGENASSEMDIEEATSTEALMPSSSIALVATSSHYNWEGTPLLPTGDVNMFLEEQCRSLDAKIETLRKTFALGASEHDIFSVSEASISLLALHMRNISEYFVDGINYVEDMLRKQLVSAIGKQVQPKDFLEYMTFHNKKLFRPEFTPQPFCYTIRRPEHYPDGTLSIVGRMEGDGTGGGEEHTIETVTRRIEGVSRMSFPINVATSVEITGQRYLHAWVTHDFEKGRNRCFSKVELAARARQFSSFILLIGKISGPDTFDPKHAIILQNKDELLIPLLLEQLPTPKEFQDAIESLSPEQKRFATAFRNMQLESSVFGVCVVQLKPQLEVLLGLPPDALTKEIRLTQDLLELFIKYQIPSDLLTYSGSEEATLSEKVALVKAYVDKVREMIAEARAKELEEAGEEADMRFEMVDNDDKPLTLKEQQVLTDTINRISADKLYGVIQIIRESTKLSGDEEEIDLEIDQLDTATQRKLQRYAMKNVKPPSLPKRVRKACRSSLNSFMAFERGDVRDTAMSCDPFDYYGGGQTPMAAMEGFRGNSRAAVMRDAMYSQCAPAFATSAAQALRQQQQQHQQQQTLGPPAAAMAPPPSSPVGGAIDSTHAYAMSAACGMGPKAHRQWLTKSNMKSVSTATPPPPPQQRASAPPGGMERNNPSAQAHVPPRTDKGGFGGGVVAEGAIDFTMIPRQLDSSFDALDDDAALRPTIVKAGPQWEKVAQQSLLTKPRMEVVGDVEQKTEKDRAFDLLDALSRSGALPIECAELHVMVAATHCFDESLMDTVIRGNVNPIEKFERSMLIVASTIHGEATARLLKDEDQVARIADVSPKLMIAANDASGATVDDAEQSRR